LMVRVRQLRAHNLLYLMEPTPARLETVEADQRQFEDALVKARRSADTPEEEEIVRAIERAFRRYRAEQASLRGEVARGRPLGDIPRVVDTHPTQRALDPCLEL